VKQVFIHPAALVMPLQVLGVRTVFPSASGKCKQLRGLPYLDTLRGHGKEEDMRAGSNLAVKKEAQN